MLFTLPDLQSVYLYQGVIELLLLAFIPGYRTDGFHNKNCNLTGLVPDRTPYFRALASQSYTLCGLILAQDRLYEKYKTSCAVKLDWWTTALDHTVGKESAFLFVVLMVTINSTAKHEVAGK